MSRLLRVTIKMFLRSKRRERDTHGLDLFDRCKVHLAKLETVEMEGGGRKERKFRTSVSRRLGSDFPSFLMFFGQRIQIPKSNRIVEIKFKFSLMIEFQTRRHSTESSFLSTLYS